ncbi:amidase family protein, partial [Devosia sp.]|uniref:amidase family protein n=1 Tax=Devosia sp. TaxID=1871048 RepID=UPI003F717A72
MTDLTKLSLADARRGLEAKSFTATELTGAYLSAIEKANPSLNAYVAVTPEQALDMAKASDEKLAKGQGGQLEGIQLGITDL